MPRSTCLVIVPAWNEEAALGATLREIMACAPDKDVLVVDDGSADNTAQVAADAGATVLSLPYNLGVGGAMRTGMKYAWRKGYEQVIQVDSDGQHNPADIDRVLAGLEQADISIGARFAGEGDYQVRGPRKWAMLFLSAIMSRYAGTRLTDVTSGFRAANRRAIRQYCDHYPAEYLGDTIDSLVMALRSGLSVTQVSVAMRPRQAGVPSNNPFKAAVYLLKSFLAIFVAMTRRKVSAQELAEEGQK
ncbi:glycosyltransferase family 2 protein [Dermabacteraceae bacterium TAE3-ERU27]|nr:glycosyltransferase family 2 protein [Dermabacteraceae bacterium TAE3-ERU27]